LLIVSAILGAVGYLIGTLFEVVSREYGEPAPNLSVMAAVFPVGVAIFMAKAAGCNAVKLGIRALRRVESRAP
jgi:hypothetical protein